MCKRDVWKEIKYYNFFYTIYAVCSSLFVSQHSQKGKKKKKKNMSLRTHNRCTHICYECDAIQFYHDYFTAEMYSFS